MAWVWSWHPNHVGCWRANLGACLGLGWWVNRSLLWDICWWLFDYGDSIVTDLDVARSQMGDDTNPVSGEVVTCGECVGSGQYNFLLRCTCYFGGFAVWNAQQDID